jgi:hypothetical protein
LETPRIADTGATPRGEQETLLGMLPPIVALMAHANCVVHSYAAHCMERLLMIKEAGALRFAPADISPALTQLLTNLFGAYPFLPVSSAINPLLHRICHRICARQLLSSTSLLQDLRWRGMTMVKTR